MITPTLITQTIFETIIALIGALSVSVCALLYFQRVRLERPAIGVFNARDIALLIVLIVLLPLLYLVMPPWLITCFLLLTFVCALFIALRPFMPARYLWPTIIAALGLNIIVTSTLLGTEIGWQIYWPLTSIVVLFAAVGVSNLYVQGGMQLKHIAWFAFLLGFYDYTFAFIIPITKSLADRFEGLPLDPSIGFKMGAYNANIGLGDLLVFGLFTIAAYKGFGRKGATLAFVMIAIFGALIPGTASLFLTLLSPATAGNAVPAQVSFGPVALIGYYWLARHAPERHMKAWYANQSAEARARATQVATKPATEVVAR